MVSLSESANDRVGPRVNSIWSFWATLGALCRSSLGAKVPISVLALAWMCQGPAVFAQEVEVPEAEFPQGDFGPQITIESIEVSGNSSTSDRVIVRALPLAVGDVVRAGSAVLSTARYRVMALGFFRDVKLSLAKGTVRGQVILQVVVRERGTIALNRMYFGTANFSPWWLGLDLSDRNFLGTGISVGGAFVFAGAGDTQGASAQQSGELRASSSEFFGTQLGWNAAFYGINASEPYRVQGEASDSSTDNFRAFDYSRIGTRAGIRHRLGKYSVLSVGGRAEIVRATLPVAPTRTLPNGETSDVDLFLNGNRTRVVTAIAGLDRDTRSDPVLPYRGDRLLLQVELGAGPLGSDYTYFSALAKYQRYWPINGNSHVLSMHLSGGSVTGDVPLFDRLHVGDINRMVSARALGLVTSTTPSLDILDTSTDEIRYGEIGGLAEVQFSKRLFRRKSFIYGGEVFVGAGLWTLVNTGDIKSRDSLPLDLLLDAGIRLDTEIGIFELSIANGLGRLPL